MPESSSSHASLEQAYPDVYPRLFRFFRLHGADADTANDLAGETFERALKALSRYDPRRGTISTWLFAIARNLACSHWKSAARWEPTAIDDLDLPDPQETPEQRIEATQDRQALEAALMQLNDRERHLLALKFAGRLNNRQIAAMTGLRENHVGVLLYRSLRHLRQLLAEPVSSTAAEVSDDRNT